MKLSLVDNMTRYLFFDIESPDGSRAAICEFGYVLTDEKFNIIDRNVLIMNPEKVIKNIYRKGVPVIKLFYGFSRYYNSPTYPTYYDKIKKLLTDSNTIVFGYSVSNDVRYVAYTTQRYGLENFDYCAYDVQIMHKKLKALKSPLSLDKAIKDVPYSQWSDLTAHRSDHDAKMTMLILKQLVKEYKLSLEEFIDSKASFKIEALKYFNLIKSGVTNKKNKNDASARWHEFAITYKASGKKTCALSGNLRKKPEIVESAIKKIKTTSFQPTPNIEVADFIIVRDKADQETVLEKHKVKKGVVFITASIFLPEIKPGDGDN